MSAQPVPITTFDPLAAAVADYVAARRQEEAATKARVEAEQRILALHPAKQEGSDTFAAGDYKVTVTGKLTYKCEQPALLAAACASAGWPQHMIPIKTDVRLDETGAKFLRANEPGAWKLLADYITVAPAKTSVKVAV